MKIFVPVLVMMACSLLLFPKVREHRILRQENESLAESIHRHREALPGNGETGMEQDQLKDSRRRVVVVPGVRGTGGTLMDLSDEKLAKLLLDLDREIPSFQSELAFRNFIENADEDVLTAFIKRMATLGLSNDIRDEILGSPLEKLGELNPEKALNLAFELPNYNLELHRGRSSKAFSDWMKDDPGEAMAWLDKLETSGGLDAKTLLQSSDLRMIFEQVILTSFLKDNYEKAKARLMSLPEELRRDTLLLDYGDDQFVDLFQQGGLDNLGQLVRELTPPSEHFENLSHFATMLTWMPAETGEAFEKLVGSMGASPEESAEMAKALALQIMYTKTVSMSPPDANAFPSSRALLSRYAPDQESRVVGEALSGIAGVTSGFMNAEDTLGLLESEFIQYPDDEMLTTFLSASGSWIESLSGAQREKLSGIVEQMQDAALKAGWQARLNSEKEEP